MDTRQLFLLVATLAAPILASAQTSPVEEQQKRLEADHQVIFFGENNNNSTMSDYQKLINQFYDDQFRHAEDPRAPYFLLMSRNAELAMGIGGTLKGMAYYDFDGAIDGSDFAPYKINIPEDPTATSEFQTTIKKSALFFTVFGHHKVIGNFKVYLEAKFAGPGNTFKLAKAYVTASNLTLGLTKSTFVDPASQPNTVETEGPNSEVDDSRVLVRYMHQAKSGFAFAISAETPDYVYDTMSGMTADTRVFMPDFAGFLQMGWGHNQHVRLSAIMKPMRYRNLVKSANDHVIGYGVNLSTVFRPFPALTVYAAGNTGRGIGSMVNDLSFGANDLLSYAGDRAGEMYAPRSYGWYAGL